MRFPPPSHPPAFVDGVGDWERRAVEEMSWVGTREEGVGKGA